MLTFTSEILEFHKGYKFTIRISNHHVDNKNILQFENRACYEKYFKDNKHNNMHFARKYARIFVLGHYLFPEARSFAGATLSENCSLPGTDHVCGQISEHIFAPNEGF